jgi:pilus assembly protein Flp/PilA
MRCTVLKSPFPRPDTPGVRRDAGSTDHGRTAPSLQGAPVQNPFATLISLVALAQDRIRREEKGATAVEYGLMVGLIAIAIITAVVLLEDQLSALFTDIGGELEDARTP